MPELLLELLSEEIPARMQAAAAEQLKRLVTKELDAAGLSYTDARAYVTPRRLTLVVEGLPIKQPDRRIERKGPRLGSAEKAIDGFGKSVGLPQHEIEYIIGLEVGGPSHTAELPALTVEVSAQSLGKGDFYVAQIMEMGKATADVLPFLIYKAIKFMDWSKSMRWAHTAMPWVRPLQNILAVFDGKQLCGGINTGHSESFFLGAAYFEPHEVKKAQNSATEKSITFPYSDATRGHRFLAPKPFKVKNFADYEAKLKKAKVLLDQAERRETIWREACRIAEAQGLKVKEDPALLAEMAGLVEWPSVLMGAIDPAFLDLPPEVLTTSMRTHQKFFSVVMPDGALAPHFIAVANVPVTDEICSGYERVLRARLADAKFFWDQDRKQTLTSRTTGLKDIVFHARLGTVAGKVERMNVLAGTLAEHVPGADPKLCRQAALLCKADLTTEMVGEFPELQGVMGRYYALADREDAAVADAIAEHYSPAGPNDACPTKPVPVAVALADKIDTLVGFFLIGQLPTGSKDPYALRRTALGVIRLIIENNLPLKLRNVFEFAWSGFKEGTDRDRLHEVSGNLLVFFVDRLKVLLREKSVRHDHIEALFAIGGEDDINRLLARVQALTEFLETDDGANLLVAYRRAANIVRIEEKNDKKSYDAEPEMGRFKAAEELSLMMALESAYHASRDARRENRFAESMSALAGLRKPVDTFFDKVTVNVEDPKLRENRLKLLSRIRSTMDAVADFSKIEGGER